MITSLCTLYTPWSILVVRYMRICRQLLHNISLVIMVVSILELGLLVQPQRQPGRAGRLCRPRLMHNTHKYPGLRKREECSYGAFSIVPWRYGHRH